MNRRLAPIVALMVSAAGCGGDATPPTSPTTTVSLVSPAGNWSGSISDAISGDGTLQLTLSERASNTLTGTWSAKFKDGDSFAGLSGAGLFASTGFGIVLYVDPPPPCEGRGPSDPLMFTLFDLAVTSSRLTAVVGRLSCNGSSFGTVNLSKQ